MNRKFSVALLLIIIVVLLSACELDTWQAYDTGQVSGPPDTSTLIAAPEPVPDETPADTSGLDTVLKFLDELLILIPAVTFGAPFIATFVDLLKRLPFRPLPNNYAPLASGIMNLALYTFCYFATDQQEEVAKGVMQAIISLSPFVLMLFTGLVFTAKAHDKLSAIGIGKSYTGEAVKGMTRAG
jgi:hypothetical protein